MTGDILKDLHFQTDFLELCEQLKTEVNDETNMFSWMIPDEMNYKTHIQFTEIDNLSKDTRQDDSVNKSLPVFEEDGQLDDLCNDKSLDISQILFHKDDNETTDWEIQIETIKKLLLTNEGNDNFSSVICMLNNVPFEHINNICNEISLSNISDNSYMGFIQEFVKWKTRLGCKITSAIIYNLFTLKIIDMDKPFSRIMLSAFILLTNQHTSLIMEQMTWIIANNRFGVVQCDLFIRLVKEAFNNRDTELFLVEILNLDFQWSTAIVMILQEILALQESFDKTMLELLLRNLHRGAVLMKKDLKFARLLQTIMPKYGEYLKTSLILFDEIVNTNETFLKKTLANMLSKLKNECK